MKRLLLTIGLLAIGGNVWSDLLSLTGTPNPNGHVFMTYITSASHTSNTGTAGTMRLGWETAQDTNIQIIGIYPDTLLTLGIDSSEVDSMFLLIKDIQVTYLNLSGSDPDSLFVALYQIVSVDSNITETDPTFDNAKAGVPWDTLGLGHGNDIAVAKSEAFGDGSVNDTMYIFYADPLFFGGEDACVDQRGTVRTGIKNSISGNRSFKIYIPLHEFRVGLANSQTVKWAFKPYRIHDADANNGCGIRYSSDDAVGSLQLDLYIYYTPTATPSTGAPGTLHSGRLTAKSGSSRIHSK